MDLDGTCIVGSDSTGDLLLLPAFNGLCVVVSDSVGALFMANALDGICIPQSSGGSFMFTGNCMFGECDVLSANCCAVLFVLKLSATISAGQVTSIQMLDYTFVQQIIKNNPEITVFPVNMIDQPSFDPTTQMVTQDGWIIGEVDVQPVWDITELDVDQALNFATLDTTDISEFITNWDTITSDDKDTVLKRLAEISVLTLTSLIHH